MQKNRFKYVKSIFQQTIEDATFNHSNENIFEVGVPGIGRTRTGKIHRCFHITEERNSSDTVRKNNAKINGRRE